jgi:hypothetical protein
MNKKKLAKLRRELKQLRAGKHNLKMSDLPRFAAKVGRRPDPKRGKEPTYISHAFPELSPLSIPSHRVVKAYTAEAIMDILEADLDKWESRLEEQELKENENTKRLPATSIRSDGDPNGA